MLAVALAVVLLAVPAVPEAAPVDVPEAAPVDVPEAAPVDVPEAAPEGWKVARNGECSGEGRTTGSLPTLMVAAVVPSCTVITPLAGMTWTSPAWSVPSHREDPVATVVAPTQHGPDADTVTV